MKKQIFFTGRVSKLPKPTISRPSDKKNPK